MVTAPVAGGAEAKVRVAGLSVALDSAAVLRAALTARSFVVSAGAVAAGSALCSVGAPVGFEPR
jgi:hypothetical protein